MHDGPDAFSFELAGNLAGASVRELEQAESTAASTVNGRKVIVDLSYITEVDTAGRALLRRWYDDGAQLVAELPQGRKIVASITGEEPELVANTARRRTWRPFRAAALWR